MITKNSIQHLLNHEGLRITVADVTDAAKEAGNIHNLSLFSEIIIGKILAATAALATDFKNHEGISLKWVTHSPLGIIRADAYEGHYVRGFIENPEAEAFDKYDPAEEKRLVCENAQLFVTRYSLLKQPYISTVNASCNSISECLTSYLNESDQTDSPGGPFWPDTRRRTPAPPDHGGSCPPAPPTAFRRPAGWPHR